MADDKITTIIKCQNIAPIENLSREVKSSSLKMGVFANNGSGKTFLSRLFRLTEKQDELVLDENDKSPTDKLLTFGKNNGTFSFKITDKDGNVKDDFSISVTKGQIPTIPDTKYLYHTFNQDYVEQNIRVLGYEKDSDIQGFILGKVNIDLKDDEDNLAKVEKEGKILSEQVEKEINTYVEENISNIQNIKRLSEYAYLKPNEIFQGIDKDLYEVSKSIDELFADYNKIKSVPENLADIENVDRINIDFTSLNEIKENLSKEFSLSSLAEDFKQKIKSKQVFVETGMELLSEIDDNTCPFCEQELQENALSLIDNYTKYIKDTEATTIKQFKGNIELLSKIIDLFKSIENANSKRINSFNEYKTKYIPSSEDVELGSIDIEEAKKSIQVLIDIIEEKLKDISKPIPVENSTVENIEKHQTLLNSIIDSNNEQIVLINAKKNRIGEENKTVRKEICKSAYNHLIETHKTNIKSIFQLREKWKTLDTEIKKKKEQQKVSKKDKVASTIKAVLNYFFSDKYTLDEKTFRLVFYENSLEKDQAKDVLSEGEKNIVAFAYYIGDTHLKIESEDDYEKLFFIIDDPISSMDFTHVYTVCGVIRDISKIIDKLKRERLIIFTHNNEFMRVLTANNIIDKKMLLKKGELKDFNNNLTVPYINHLMDVYNIARRNELANHTTANSIRHIIETLTKFQNVDISKDGIAEYIKKNIPNDTKSYTLINDLSHGGWRSEQSPITEDDYKDVCETIIKHIENSFKGQVDYCEKFNTN
ncbi:AAA family ATPase [Polluticaenibacter yanchengensis]|uniref:AAA family ATPase n=1 Tax=Polluticaenibacter yanchengensis TaxID=3014562 RepID=A0ABT4UHM8_9BACT|nr:AAA family ATPase [Chitinophagaceae bacterium LY-5]